MLMSIHIPPARNSGSVTSGAVFVTKVLRPLTDAQSEVEDAEPDVQPKEEDDVGYFAEQEQVAHVLLQCD